MTDKHDVRAEFTGPAFVNHDRICIQGAQCPRRVDHTLSVFLVNALAEEVARLRNE